MQQLQPLFVWILIVMAITAPALAQQPEHAPKRPTLLLVEHEQHPRVTITWTADGQPQRHTMVMPFTAPVGGEQLGDSNALAYATMGGTRIETGAGHPKGAVIRVGLTKAERTKAFFKSIDPGTSIEISITGVRVKRGINASPGALDAKPGHGQVEIIVQPDDPTLVDMHVQLPYALLRHLQDPWVSDLPGTFFEPIHFHAEAELIPVDVAPLVREEIIPEINESQRPNAEPARD